MAPSTAAIDVLLVDDDEDWVSVTARLLEAEDDSLAVATSIGGEAAITRLSAESVDCVVCDYKMPGTDGLAVLRWVREEQPETPFIMITSSGTESVASEAISAGVTDYFVKEPRVDQSTTLAARIRNAVEAARAARALERNERRFSALFDGVPDPVVLTAGTNRVVRDANPAFASTFGLDRDAIVGEPLPDLTVTVEEGSYGAVGTDDSVTVAEVRCRTADGVRDFLYRGFPIESEDGPEEYGVYTDVTARKERERALRRERDLEAELRELVLGAESRAQVETALCDLAAEDHAFAWIGGFDQRGALAIRASAGDDRDSLGALTRYASATAEPAAPSLVALRTSEPQVVDVPRPNGVGNGNPDGASTEAEAVLTWLGEGHAADVGSVAAVPVESSGIPRGVLAVYDNRRGAFDASALDGLLELADALGVAYEVLDRQAVLSADRVIEVGCQVAGTDHPLADASATLESPLSVTGQLPREDDTVQYFVEFAPVDVTSPENWLANCEDVSDVSIIATEPTLRVRLVAPPTFASAFAARGGLVRSMSVDGRTIEATVEASASVDVPALVDDLREETPGLSVTFYRERDRPVEWRAPTSLPGDLTDKQREALLAAYHSGYFERPRRQSAEEIADSLGVSRTTFLHHLRIAERKVVEALVEA